MFLTTTNTITNVSAVEANGVGVYWDSNCNDAVSSIDWGTLKPGSVKNIPVYIRNEGEKPMHLIFLTANWNPSKASEYLNLGWNYTEGRLMDPGEALQITLTLSISNNIEGISNFGFDIVITQFFPDLDGPVTSDVAVSPNPTNGATSVTLSATIDDSTTGNSIIVEAEYFVDKVGGDGTGTPMATSDGAFNSPTEGVTAYIDVSGGALGDYTLYVHGKDAAGNWGSVGSLVLHVTEEVAYVMHIESIDMSKTDLWFLKWAVAVVVIFDADSNPVEGATVYGTWSGLTTELEFGVTGPDGKVTFYTNWIWSLNSGTCIFTVNYVTKTGWTYYPEENKETSDSITI